MDNKELELAYDLLTADEESILTKAVQDKGTDCDEMKKLRKVYGGFVASVAMSWTRRASRRLPSRPSPRTHPTAWSHRFCT